MQYHLLIGRSCQESRGCKRGIGPLGGISWGGTVSNVGYLYLMFFQFIDFCERGTKIN